MVQCNLISFILMVHSVLLKNSADRRHPSLQDSLLPPQVTLFNWARGSEWSCRWLPQERHTIGNGIPRLNGVLWL